MQTNSSLYDQLNMCHGFVFLNLVSPRRPFTLLYGQHMCSFILTIMKCPDSVVTVTDVQEQTELPIDGNLPKSVESENSGQWKGALLFQYLKNPGSTIISAPQRDAGRPNKRPPASSHSRGVSSYWNKQLPIASREMVTTAALALAVCSYPLLFHHAVTPKGQWVLFFSSSVLFWNWNAILSERWLFSIGQY